MAKFGKIDRDMYRSELTRARFTLARQLEERQGAWGAHITEPSTEPVSISMDLNRADGQTDHVDIVAVLAAVTTCVFQSARESSGHTDRSEGF